MLERTSRSVWKSSSELGYSTPSTDTVTGTTRVDGVEVEQMQSWGRRCVDGVGRLKVDFHTGWPRTTGASWAAPSGRRRSLWSWSGSWWRSWPPSRSTRCTAGCSGSTRPRARGARGRRGARSSLPTSAATSPPSVVVTVNHCITLQGPRTPGSRSPAGGTATRSARRGGSSLTTCACRSCPRRCSASAAATA